MSSGKILLWTVIGGIDGLLLVAVAIVWLAILRPDGNVTVAGADEHGALQPNPPGVDSEAVPRPPREGHPVAAFARTRDMAPCPPRDGHPPTVKPLNDSCPANSDRPVDYLGPLEVPSRDIDLPPKPAGKSEEAIQGDAVAPATGTERLVQLGPGGFGGRLDATTRRQMLLMGGGDARSEAAVALGLRWLALHQADDGHWSLCGFPYDAHDTGSADDRQPYCNCTGGGFNFKNHIAGTAFGLLPFLAAGHTHQAARDAERADHSRTVRRGLEYLMVHQAANGDFGGGAVDHMYNQGLATIVLCEAYGLSGDEMLRSSAQRALAIIEAAQGASGGWRYQPRARDGDTSVLGWQLMALQSGALARLRVRPETLASASRWLDACMTPAGGYGYLDTREETPATTAIGLLCRQYLGWEPHHPRLLAGVRRLEQNPPATARNIYYYYYATQVMHHLGGDAWRNWNAPMRDWLVRTQDQGNDPRHDHQRGSWSPAGDLHGSAGGRIMVTSLALLTLEIYYRYLPLYQSTTTKGL